MKRGVCAALVAAVAVCGAGAPTAASGSDVPRTPSGWRVTPAGHLLTVTQGPGLSGPWGVALSPDGRHALVTSSGQAVQDETLEMFDITSRARTDNLWAWQYKSIGFPATYSRTRKCNGPSWQIS